MSKKQKMYIVKNTEKKNAKVIDMNKMNLHKSYIVANFKTGAHSTEKDKPRDKNWRKWED